MPPGVQKLRWLGSEQSCLDQPVVDACGRVVIGRYGGHSGAGAVGNEDGALVWCAAEGSWELAALLDAHGGAESAGLVLDALEANAGTLQEALAEPVETALGSLQQRLVSLFQSAALREQCRAVEGETACLIAARKGRFLWWLSVGDCVLYLFHPELARLGQYALNQRQYFEWIGRANSFELPVPCYTTGTRELRSGQSRILMVTDGLLECGSRPFADPCGLYEIFAPEPEAERAGVDAGVAAALARVHHERGRDSATIIAWDCAAGEPGLRPSS